MNFFKVPCNNIYPPHVDLIIQINDRWEAETDTSSKNLLVCEKSTLFLKWDVKAWPRFFTLSQSAALSRT